jgi:hypothetical protein
MAGSGPEACAGDAGQDICYTHNAGASPVWAAERWQSG